MQLRNHPVGIFHITRARTTLQVQHDGPIFAKTLQAPRIRFDPQPTTPQARRPTAAGCDADRADKRDHKGTEEGEPAR